MKFESKLKFEGGDIMPDDMCFPKASVDPKQTSLQAHVTEFLTSIIIKHELEFYKLVSSNFPGKLKSILATTCSSIITMIVETTNKFYNDLYRDIQSKVKSYLTFEILDMSSMADYGPHRLLDKLIRMTIEIHLDIVREKLIIDNTEVYRKSVLEQINLWLLSHNLLHILSKTDADDIPFVNIPDGKSAFNIVIDKNIRA